MDDNFFNWIVSIFKKKKPVVILPTAEELKKQKEFEAIKAKYMLEYLESYNAYFVKYLYMNQWWYLRKWDSEDYTIERLRGNAIRIGSPEQLDEVIFAHQDWIGEGHIHLNYD